MSTWEFFFLSGSKLGPYVFTIDIWNLNIEMSLKIIYRICTWFETNFLRFKLLIGKRSILQCTRISQYYPDHHLSSLGQRPELFVSTSILSAQYFALASPWTLWGPKSTKVQSKAKEKKKRGDELNSVEDFVYIVR